MKKVFLDTNFLMDYMVRPEYSSQASQVLKEGLKQGYRFVVSFLTVANFAYINRKLPQEARRELLGDIMELFEVTDNTASHLWNALEMTAADYEDAVQYHTALSSGCCCIITRNKKDFPFANIPIFTPSEFLEYLG